MTPCPNRDCVAGLVGGDVCPECEGHETIEERDAARAKREKRKRGDGITRVWVAEEPTSGIVAPPAVTFADVARTSAPTFDARFAEAIAASEEPDDAPESTVPRPVTSDATTSGDRARAEATDLAPGPFGMLLWVEKKRIKAGLDPLDPQWLWHFDTFYASGKPVDVGRFGLRAAKSWSVCTALVAESLLMPRRLAVVGRCPIMSSNRYEANDRFVTLCEVLRAVGLSEITRGDQDSGSFKTSGGGNSPYLIELFDFDGHAIEFKTQAASVASAAGFTGIAGFGDELDLWGKADGANPAKQVVEILTTRYTTQFVAGARLHLMSATYDRDSYHAQLIDGKMVDGRLVGGDDALHYVARLGEKGAAKDNAARLRLAQAIGSADPLLLTPADPASKNISSWVSNPVTPIESCYLGANNDLRRMFSLYGARPELAEGGPSEQWRGLVDRNAQLRERVQGRSPVATLGQHPNAQPGDPRYAGPVRRGPGGGPTL